jgi:hypothetical protein
VKQEPQRGSCFTGVPHTDHEPRGRFRRSILLDETRCRVCARPVDSPDKLIAWARPSATVSKFGSFFGCGPHASDLTGLRMHRRLPPLLTPPPVDKRTRRMGEPERHRPLELAIRSLLTPVDQEIQSPVAVGGELLSEQFSKRHPVRCYPLGQQCLRLGNQPHTERGNDAASS